MAFHGVNFPDHSSSNNGKGKVFNSIMSGLNKGKMLLPGAGQVYSNDQAINKTD